MTIEEIRRRKDELGYSAEQLSRKSGVPIGTLQKILSGQTKVPRYETRMALERALNQSERMLNQPEKVDNRADGKHTYDTTVSQATMVRESAAYGSVPDDSSVSGSVAVAGRSMMKRQGDYTLDDYYAWPEDERIELIDGVIYFMAAPTFIHQRFAFHFAYLVQNYISSKGGSCIPMVSPVDVRLDCDNKTMIQPDVLILCDKSKIRRWGIEGAPEFVAEVLSDSSRKKDLSVKMRKYLNAGVKEYWIFDPKEKRLYVYDFREEGIPGVYPLTGEVGLGLYDGDLKIPLDEFAVMFEDIPEEE